MAAAAAPVPAGLGRRDAVVRRGRRGRRRAGQLVGWSDPAYRLWYLAGPSPPAPGWGWARSTCCARPGLTSWWPWVSSPAPSRGPHSAAAPPGGPPGRPGRRGDRRRHRRHVRRRRLPSPGATGMFGHATALVVFLGTAYPGGRCGVRRSTAPGCSIPTRHPPRSRLPGECCAVMTPMFNIAGARALLFGPGTAGGSSGAAGRARNGSSAPD